MGDTQMIEQLEAEQSMFVQTARGMTSDGKTLTLEGVTPSTLYFSDRPQRIVGHMATNDFVNLWGEGDNSFEEDPPNAVLAFLEPGDDVPEDAVIVIEVPRLENGQLSYSIQTLEGTLPAQAGPVTLFIDPFGGRCPRSRCVACAGASADATGDGSNRHAHRPPPYRHERSTAFTAHALAPRAGRPHSVRCCGTRARGRP